MPRPYEPACVALLPQAGSLWEGEACLAPYEHQTGAKGPYKKPGADFPPGLLTQLSKITDS